MAEFFSSFSLFSLALTFGAFQVGLWCQKKTRSPLCNPLLIAVILVIGVNGVGKTTTIGKIATRLVAEGKNVLLVAGDTFRAAAADQLEIWAERSGAAIVRQHEGADPASVVGKITVVGIVALHHPLDFGIYKSIDLQTTAVYHSPCLALGISVFVAKIIPVRVIRIMTGANGIESELLNGSHIPVHFRMSHGITAVFIRHNILLNHV